MFFMLERIIPDLILLDVEMPVMDGFEAIKLLKTDTRYADIPVIFLTSKTDDESRKKGLELGAADYIGKPYYPALLLDHIKTVIKSI
jgi:putative two-component system response regulator